MNENRNGNAMDERERKDKQYDRAISLIQYYVQLTWLVYGAFLLAETVLLGAVAQIAKDQHELAIGGSILGLFLAIPWWASFKYNHSLYLLRMSEARACEPDTGTFFTSGGDIIGGKTIHDPAMGAISIPRLARFLRPARAVTWLIYIFAATYALIAWKCWK
jgi:hypothetical protein